MPPTRSPAPPSAAHPRGRLLISTSTFPSNRAEGGPRFVQDLAEALAEHYAVTVLAPAAPDAAREERWGDLEVRRFPYFWPGRLQQLAYGRGMRGNMEASLLAKLQVPTFLWCQQRAIRRLVRQQRIDWVNTHWLVPQGLTAAWARGAGGRFRHLLQVHAADVYMLRGLSFGRRLARFVLSRTDAVFAAGSHVRDTLDELLGYPSGALLQPMGSQVDRFRTASGDSPAAGRFAEGYLLYVGRFAEKKGVTYLLQAMPEILRVHPGLGLVLVGFGPLEPQLRRECEQLGLGPAVQFAGRLSHDEVIRYLHGCRVAVVPSIIDSRGETEGMPTVVVETMAAGALVVASNVDGIPDLVEHGVNGWLCRQKDPVDLAAKILAALHCDSPGTVLDAARATADRLDWRQIAGAYRKRLDAVDGAAGGGRPPSE